MFLKRLRAARRQSGLKQVEVAQAFGSTQTFISKCERGDRLVNALDLFDFAQLYGVPMSSLVPARLGAPGAIPDIAPGRDRRVAEPRVRPGRGEKGAVKKAAEKKDAARKTAGKKGAAKKTTGRKDAGKSGVGKGKAGAGQGKPGRRNAGKGNTRGRKPRKPRPPPEGSK